MQRMVIIGEIFSFRDSVSCALKDVLDKRLPYLTATFRNLKESLSKDDLAVSPFFHPSLSISLSLFSHWVRCHHHWENRSLLIPLSYRQFVLKVYKCNQMNTILPVVYSWSVIIPFKLSPPLSYRLLIHGSSFRLEWQFVSLDLQLLLFPVIDH